MDPLRILKSKATTILLIGVLAAVGFIATDLYIQKVKVDQEIQKLKAQTETLSQDNKQLSDLIKYLDTTEYKEKEAREKLNLKKPGEEVVVLPSDEELTKASLANLEEKTNPQKWLAYFFDKDEK